MAKAKKITDTGLITENRQGYSGPDEAVITRLIEQTKWRTRQDIDTWRNAILAAENIINPYRVPLYTLYEEIILDGHIQGIIGQRRDALLAEPFKIVDSKGVKSDVLTDMFDDEWFYTYMSLVHDSVYWGHTLIQLWEPIPDEGYGQIIEVPRRHVMPEFGIVSRVQGDTSAVETNYRQAPYVDWVVEAMPQGPRGHGLFKIAAPDFIIKKNAKLNWSQYTEIFGMPIRVGKTRSTKQVDVNRMSDVLKRMGAAGYGVFQEGEGIEFIESTKGDAYNVYDKLIERSNSELSKLIIRQTMTVEDGSSRSQGEVHERTMEVLKEFDKRMIRQSVKKQLMKRMNGHGLIPEGYRFMWEATVDLEALWKKVVGAFTAFEVDEKWIETTFGIPVTKKLLPAGEIPDDDKDPDKEGDDDNPKDPKDKGKRPKPTGAPKKKSLSVSDKLILLNKRYNCTCGKCGGLHPDAVTLAATKAKRVPTDYDAFLAWFHGNPDSKEPHAATVESIGGDLWGGAKKVIGTTDIADTVQLNLYRFAAAKTLTMQAALKPHLKDDDGKERSLADFKTAAQPVTDTFKAYQQTEYNTAFSRAQIARQWGDIQQDIELYPNLTWKGIGDARERPAHVALNELCLPADNVLWKKYTPGMDYNCRCQWEQSAPDATLTKQSKAQQLFEQAAPPVELQGNPGMDGTLIKESHPYFNGNVKKINSLDMGDYMK